MNRNQMRQLLAGTEITFKAHKDGTFTVTRRYGVNRSFTTTMELILKGAGYDMVRLEYYSTNNRFQHLVIQPIAVKPMLTSKSKKIQEFVIDFGNGLIYQDGYMWYYVSRVRDTFVLTSGENDKPMENDEAFTTVEALENRMRAIAKLSKWKAF